ncbi:TetR/AcrR family transcriptional regulator [Nocardia sp. alder85J]|uniref:TetR/AcrR family transcriptional regulator n=1 Tax=Nocardia sp. alder85J TaxID=2862949 RepID=UPI001CD28CE6|nr:TetR family transcriptional regulator [Nocardia sp. alder85J]MCX4096793.1 TetR/AcrR family transcriptional regulator C-terminal domain-containing protein [Nocardia sp. alder85J]
MAKQGTAEKRPRRERGSLNPEDIIEGAFELAEEVSIDGLSMPLLGKHLGVGVTSIYWYFRKKDDLLNAMTDRALHKYAFETPFVETGDWRATLTEHARTMRQAFLDDPILCDLVLIRAAMSSRAGRLGADMSEAVVASLVHAGLPLEEAFDAYSAVHLLVRGSVVLQRLYDKNKELDGEANAYYDKLIFEPETTPLLAQATAGGRRSGAPDDHNFEYGLTCILDHAAALIEAAAAKPPARRAAAKRPAKKAAPAAETTEHAAPARRPRKAATSR